MNVEEFDYDLPESLIAQTPLKDRDQSRLLVLGRNSGNIEHKHFKDVINYLETGDTLVLNDTRVMPARLFGLKEVLLKPAKRIKVGNKLSFGEGKIIAECIEELDQGGRIMRLHYEGILEERLNELGEMPLPPYIKERLDDPDRYQTVYAKESGSAAAPTAGLHFTDELLDEIRAKGINIAYITLHVGLGTFRPVSVEDINDHEMHSEYYQMTQETANLLNQTKKEGHRIISVGTTSTRTLETIRRDYNEFVAVSGWTDIFIYPGFTYKAIDGLITNFHLPKSTLVMLVSAFSSRENILNAYKEAVKLEYRFFSFGDAMLII